MDAPPIVMHLARSVNGAPPLAWKEYDDHFVIVMSDGRKYTFAKKNPELPRHKTELDDMKEPVDRAEIPQPLHQRKPPRRDK